MKADNNLLIPLSKKNTFSTNSKINVEINNNLDSIKINGERKLPLPSILQEEFENKLEEFLKNENIEYHNIKKLRGYIINILEKENILNNIQSDNINDIKINIVFKINQIIKSIKSTTLCNDGSCIFVMNQGKKIKYIFFSPTNQNKHTYYIKQSFPNMIVLEKHNLIDGRIKFNSKKIKGERAVAKLKNQFGIYAEYKIILSYVSQQHIINIFDHYKDQFIPFQSMISYSDSSNNYIDIDINNSKITYNKEEYSKNEISNWEEIENLTKEYTGSAKYIFESKKIKEFHNKLKEVLGKNNTSINNNTKIYTGDYKNKKWVYCHEIKDNIINIYQLQNQRKKITTVIDLNKNIVTIYDVMLLGREFICNILKIEIDLNGKNIDIKCCKLDKNTYTGYIGASLLNVDLENLCKVFKENLQSARSVNSLATKIWKIKLKDMIKRVKKLQTEDDKKDKKQEELEEDVRELKEVEKTLKKRDYDKFKKIKNDSMMGISDVLDDRDIFIEDDKEDNSLNEEDNDINLFDKYKEVQNDSMMILSNDAKYKDIKLFKELVKETGDMFLKFSNIFKKISNITLNFSKSSDINERKNIFKDDDLNNIEERKSGIKQENTSKRIYEKLNNHEEIIRIYEFYNKYELHYEGGKIEESLNIGITRDNEENINQLDDYYK